MADFSNLLVQVKTGSAIARLAAYYMRSSSVALVIGRTIHLHGISKEGFITNTAWVKHELKHVAQYERMGTWRFLWVYLFYSIKFGYRNNPLEIEARAAEDQPLPDAFTLV